MDELRPPRDARRAGPSRACSATSCCARRSPRGRRATAGHSTEDELRPADDARDPAPARLRPRRAGRGARDVRAAGRAARRLARALRAGAGRCGPMTGQDVAWLVLAAAARGRSPRCSRPPTRRWPGSRARPSTSWPGRAGAGPRGWARMVARPGALPQRRAASAGSPARCWRRCSSRGSASSTCTHVVGWPCVVAAAVMVVVSYVLVGVAPRTLARQHAGAGGARARPAPVVAARDGARRRSPSCSSCSATRSPRARASARVRSRSEAELRELVDLAEQDRLIEDDERQMIHSVFELGDTLAREVMVPRTDMVFIERGKTLRQALSLALRSGFSRIPVVGESVDDVVGFVYLKDVVRRIHEYRDAEQNEHVEDVMRPATFVPDSKPVDELLREMQAQRIHAAVVVDEYGGTAGPGHDRGHPRGDRRRDRRRVRHRRDPEIEELPDGDVRVSARLHVDDLVELFDLDVPTTESTTSTASAACWPSCSARSRSPARRRRSTGCGCARSRSPGRRNRIGTVLVAPAGRRRPTDGRQRRGRAIGPTDAAPTRRGARRCRACDGAELDPRGRQARHARPVQPAAQAARCRERGRRRARRDRPHVHRGDGRAAVPAAVRAAGRRRRSRRPAVRGRSRPRRSWCGHAGTRRPEDLAAVRDLGGAGALGAASRPPDGALAATVRA